jgi:hypothetical protein
MKIIFLLQILLRKFRAALKLKFVKVFKLQNCEINFFQHHAHFYTWYVAHFRRGEKAIRK